MARRTAVMIGALVGAMAAALVGGIAWAAIPGPGGVIQGCYDNGGNLKVVDALPCPKNWKPLQWNQTGSPGADGTNGTSGEDGVSPTVAQLQEGDEHCPTGGAAITDANQVTAYVCNGAAGADGDDFSGAYTAGEYSISVTEEGITLSGPASNTIEMTDAGIAIDAGSLPLTIDSGAFDLDASTIDAAAATTASVKGGLSFKAEGAATAEIKAPQALIDGALIRLGFGCGSPVATVGSIVTLTASNGVVATGDPTVLAC